MRPQTIPANTSTEISNSTIPYPSTTAMRILTSSTILLRQVRTSSWLPAPTATSVENIQHRKVYDSKINNILTDVNNDGQNLLVASIVSVWKTRRPPSLKREGKLRRSISSKDIAGKDEASTFDGNCRR